MFQATRVYFGAVPKPGLSVKVATGRASGMKSQGYCLSAYLQHAIPVILTVAMPYCGA